VFDAAAHRPRYAVIDKADPVVRDAEAAYREGVRGLEDAWKTQSGGAGGEPLTTAPSAEPGSDDDVESPRDAYIRQISNAYKTPMGQAPAASADDIERARQQWLSPGAKPGGGFDDARPGVSRETATQDARETAYREYVARLVNGWRK
jgi:hypothetical protein